MGLSLTFAEIAGSLGAMADGLEEQETRDSGGALRDALLVHRVLILRGLAPDPDRLVELARLFGTPRDEDTGAAYEVVDAVVRANAWHADLTYLPEPNVVTMMQIERGPRFGGDTAWANMSAGYAALPPLVREQLVGLVAVHRDPIRRDPPVPHPVVRRHPVTGEPALYVNRYYTAGIVGMDEHESSMLLGQLWEASESVHRTCRWRWQPGDIAIWDNTCTVHIGVDDYAADAKRLFYRVSVAGDDPVGWEPPVHSASLAG